jgi:uncharacterized protein (TIGR03086 family)
MSDVADRYRRLSEAFAARIATVPADRWDSPSPCDGWTARDVVRHVVDSQARFLQLVGREIGPLPAVADDPAGAWAAARAAMQADLDDPDRAAAEFDGMFGRSTLAQAVDRFGCTDLVVHAWDLARATGQDERLDPEEVRRVLASMAGLEDSMRGPRTFGPPVDVPPDAGEQARMLAFLGRDPRPAFPERP